MCKLRRALNIIDVGPNHLAPMQGPVAFSRIDDAIPDPHLMHKPVQLPRLNRDGARLGGAASAESFLEGAARWRQKTRVAPGVGKAQRNLVTLHKNMVGLPGITCAHAPNPILLQNGVPLRPNYRDTGFSVASDLNGQAQDVKLCLRG